MGNIFLISFFIRMYVVCMYENHDIAITMSSSRADPVLGLRILQG